MPATVNLDGNLCEEGGAATNTDTAGRVSGCPVGKVMCPADSAQAGSCLAAASDCAAQRIKRCHWDKCDASTSMCVVYQAPSTTAANAAEVYSMCGGCGDSTQEKILSDKCPATPSSPPAATVPSSPATSIADCYHPRCPNAAKCQVYSDANGTVWSICGSCDATVEGRQRHEVNVCATVDGATPPALPPTSTVPSTPPTSTGGGSAGREPGCPDSQVMCPAGTAKAGACVAADADCVAQPSKRCTWDQCSTGVCYVYQAPSTTAANAAAVYSMCGGCGSTEKEKFLSDKCRATPDTNPATSIADCYHPRCPNAAKCQVYSDANGTVWSICGSCDATVEGRQRHEVNVCATVDGATPPALPPTSTVPSTPPTSTGGGSAGREPGCPDSQVMCPAGTAKAGACVAADADCVAQPSKRCTWDQCSTGVCYVYQAPSTTAANAAAVYSMCGGCGSTEKEKFLSDKCVLGQPSASTPPAIVGREKAVCYNPR